MSAADDTIVAISTPAGRGGIGIVRLSGVGAKGIAEGLVRLKRPLEAGRARFGVVLDANSAGVLDEAVVTYFKGPRSYTGEDVVEIAAHGSPVVMDYLLRQCVAQGARLAEAGEFTERAFLSGRLDLTQAEAVHGLIEATTLEQARMAARQLGGGLSRQVGPVKERLIALIAGLEAGIDFAEDDLELMAAGEIAARMREIAGPLREMEESFAHGRALREGFRLAIVGRPNAGKSSLFNRLLRRERAIVTAQPGTTRDTVSERLEFAGIPVELVDTAGLRAGTVTGGALDEAEAFGVAKSREAMAEADVVLLVVAADEAVHAEDIAARDLAAGRKLIVVRNKIDLVRRGSGRPTDREGQQRDEWGTDFEGPDFTGADLWGTEFAGAIGTSAVEGTGIEELRRVVVEAVRGAPQMADTVPLTNLRQHEAVSAALGAVRAAESGVDRGVPHEMLLMDLHEGLDALDLLTGTTHTDEILSLIFSKFCIGK